MLFVTFITLIFIRPFISSLAFPYLNSVYSILLLAFLAAWVIAKGIPFEKIHVLRYPLIFFILALFISAIFSLNKINSYEEFYKYATGLLLFLAAMSLADKDKMRLVRIITFAGFIISILAIYQYLFGFQHLMDYCAKKETVDTFVLDYIARRRVYFPFVTPNTLAGYLILTIPLALILKGKKKWVILCFLLSALFLTKSLGALLSLILGMILYLYLRENLSGKRIAALGILVMSLVFIFILRQTGTKEHTLPLFSLAKRLTYWQDALEIIKAHWLTGVGLGNFNLPASRYSHNSYLQIWAETGIIGIISFIWLISAVFKNGFQNIRNYLSDNKETALLLTASAIFILHNFMDFTFFLPEVSLIWWTILGMALLRN